MTSHEAENLARSRENLKRARQVLAVIAEVVFHANVLDIHELLDYLDTLRPGLTIRQVRGAFTQVAIADLRHAHERIGEVLAVIDTEASLDARARPRRSA